jgi:hypothetical protein
VARAALVDNYGADVAEARDVDIIVPSGASPSQKPSARHSLAVGGNVMIE